MDKEQLQPHREGQQPAAMNNDQASKIVAGMVRNPTTGEMVKRRKSKPLKVIERDMEIIRLMHLVQDASVVASRMGVSKRRVYQIVEQYKDAMKDELGKMDPNTLAASAVSRYETLFNEAIHLAVEAVKITDPKDRITAKGMAYDRAMKVQGALDNLFKLLGIYKEHSIVEHVDLLKTEEWMRLEEAIRIFLRLYIGVDPSVFTDFVERVQTDKDYFKYMKLQADDRERRQGLYKPEMAFNIDDFKKNVAHAKESAHTSIKDNVAEELHLNKGEPVIDAEYTELNDEGEAYDTGPTVDQGEDGTESRTGQGNNSRDVDKPPVHIVQNPGA